MEMTHRTDYALRMLAELVRHPGEVVSVRAVAEREAIPYSFARSIQHDLVRAGIVRSIRGSRGGMLLAIDPAEVSFLQALESIQGPVSSAGDEARSYTPDRPFGAVLYGAGALLRDYLASVSLADVVHGTKAPRLSERFRSEDAFDETLATV